MGNVISSNFNALVDGLQDPRKSVEQTLLEMQEQIRAARREVVSAVAAEKQLRSKLEELAAQAEKWANRAELAVKSGDDDLARDALLQKKRVTTERDRAEALRAEQRAAAHEMKCRARAHGTENDELEPAKARSWRKPPKPRPAAARRPRYQNASGLRLRRVTPHGRPDRGGGNHRASSARARRL